MFNSVVFGMGRLLASFYEFIPNYGVAIIMLTVLVRVMMIPLAVKQAHIMEANRGNAERMRKLAPEVKKLKEKYKDDRAKQYEEQKKLYDQHGVNMLGGLSGCLPMLLQMPVFYAMYSVLSGCNKIFGSGRVCEVGFHVPDGSALKTAILEGQSTFLGMNLNFQPSSVLADAGLVAALPYYLLIAVMGYTMWFQTRQMIKAQPVVDPQMAQTQKIMQFLPIMLAFASLSFPAGLTVYWSATNIWAIAQQSVLMRLVGPLSKSGRVASAAREKEDPPVVASAKGSAKTATGNGKPAPTKLAPTKLAPTKLVKGKAPIGKAPRPGAAGSKQPSGGTKAKAASSAPRKPAAQRARSTAGVKAAQPASDGQAGKSNGSSPGPGRPKGSGARKGSKGSKGNRK